jgi:acyl dehydratase
MPIEIDKVLGARFAERRDSWTVNDVLLYHLALGAGSVPTDPAELRYTYEASLDVLPSFGVVSASASVLELIGLPGMDVELGQILHGEQDLVMHDVLPAEGSVVVDARVVDVRDNGNAALVVLETVTTAEEDGRLLCTNRFGMFVRGAGGFGGKGSFATDIGANAVPDRPPDHVVACPTLPQQALLYRLCGDRNPLHVDPAFARRAGFERPILHGLCTYGICCKAVVDTLLDGDVGRVAGYSARFAGIVFPGETIEVAMWDEGDRVVIIAETRERRKRVLSNASVAVRDRALKTHGEPACAGASKKP